MRPWKTQVTRWSTSSSSNGQPARLRCAQDANLLGEFLARAAGHSGDYVTWKSNEPAFILATSGTTAKPKLAIHTHGGYQVHIHSMGSGCLT